MYIQLRQIYENVITSSNLDAEYREAVNNKDINTIQRIVQTQRNQQGYKGVYYSGSIGDRGTVYKRAYQNGIWLSKDKQTAVEYATIAGNTTGVVRQLTIKIKNPLDLRELGIQNTSEQIRNFLQQKNINLPDVYYRSFEYRAKIEEQSDWFVYSIIDGRNFKTDREYAISAIQKAGFDGLIISDTHYGSQSDSYVAFSSNQVKLMSLATIDDDKQLIPISQRFDLNNPDIRY